MLLLLPIDLCFVGLWGGEPDELGRYQKRLAPTYFLGVFVRWLLFLLIGTLFGDSHAYSALFIGCLLAGTLFGFWEGTLMIVREGGRHVPSGS